MTLRELREMWENAWGTEPVSAPRPRHPHREAVALMVLAELDPTPRLQGFAYTKGSELYFTASPEEVAAREREALPRNATDLARQLFAQIFSGVHW